MLHLYGLIVGFSLVVLWSIAERIDRRVASVLPSVVIFALIGARLYHVIDLWEYYSEHFLLVFTIWNGGLGAFGGIIGGVVGLKVKAKDSREFFDILAAVVIGLPLAQAVGRWGNFANNELWGKGHAPLFLYESLLDVILFVILWVFHTKKWSSKRLVGVYAMGYGLIRLALEPLKVDPWWVGYVIALIFVLIGVDMVLKTVLTEE